MSDVSTFASGSRVASGPAVPPPDASKDRGPGLLARHPEWPIVALVVGYPVWWALGVADFTWIFLAIPMIARLLAWRAFGRKIKLPPGFGIWLLFLVCATAGFATLTLTAPGTVESAISNRVISYADRMSGYFGVTILLLYAGNLTERELPRRRLAWMLGFLAIVTTIGGVAAMIAPHFQFNSPFLLVLPHSVQANAFIQASMHPGLAQVQNVLGTAAGRPKAPFDYTNLWGDCLTILVPWLLVGWWSGGTKRQRWIAGVTVAIAVFPLLYSLNRGAWIGVVVAILYVAVRLAARGKMAVLGALLALVGVAMILIVATPLQQTFSGRLANGKSDNLRSNLATLAIKDAIASPIIGFGDTRQEAGSSSSISVGPSPKCPICGQQAVGSTGQLWLLLVCSGFVGAGLYLGFFAYGIWRFRRDTTPYGFAGVLVLLLSFIYMFTYDATGAPIGFTMIAYALLWKNDAIALEPASAERDGQSELDRADPDHDGPRGAAAARRAAIQARLRP